ncbi:MAG: BlaI/MecI/CopY family transcriptional regulator [bacterium]|nr:BlaI/MecI/CopY family transcriptional regulator [bacterium]
MKNGETRSPFSRRERQIMEIIYRLGRASVSDVMEEMPDPPSYSAVRASLRILEEKGHLSHEQVGRRYMYLPVVAREKARGSVLRGLLENFFGGSRSKLVAALLDDPDGKPSEEELEVISRLIKAARREGN